MRGVVAIKSSQEHQRRYSNSPPEECLFVLQVFKEMREEEDKEGRRKNEVNESGLLVSERLCKSRPAKHSAART